MINNSEWPAAIFLS